MPPRSAPCAPGPAPRRPAAGARPAPGTAPRPGRSPTGPRPARVALGLAAGLARPEPAGEVGEREQPHPGLPGQRGRLTGRGVAGLDGPLPVLVEQGGLVDEQVGPLRRGPRGRAGPRVPGDHDPPARARRAEHGPRLDQRAVGEHDVSPRCRRPQSGPSGTPSALAAPTSRPPGAPPRPARNPGSGSRGPSGRPPGAPRPRSTPRPRPPAPAAGRAGGRPPGGRP